MLIFYDFKLTKKKGSKIESPATATAGQMKAARTPAGTAEEKRNDNKESLLSNKTPLSISPRDTAAASVVPSDSSVARSGAAGARQALHENVTSMNEEVVTSMNNGTAILEAGLVMNGDDPEKPSRIVDERHPSIVDDSADKSRGSIPPSIIVASPSSLLAGNGAKPSRLRKRQPRSTTTTTSSSSTSTTIARPHPH